MERNISFGASLLAVAVFFVALLPSVHVFASWQTDGNPICTVGGDQYPPTITSDGAGGAIIAWYDYRGYNYDIYVQRVGAWGSIQWAPEGVALCTATGNQYYPAIISDGAGGAIVTWIDYRSGNADIYAQRVSAEGIAQWTTDGVALCTATGDQRSPMICTDGTSGAVVTWMDLRSGTDCDIYGQRVNASGAVQWTADGVALCAAIGDQQNPAIVSNGAGGANVTWHDFRNGTDYDIYAQGVNASGSVQWTIDGVALCAAIGDQQNPSIVSDGAGGAIVTWNDNRNGNDDIYAQRVNVSGVVQWVGNGAALCAAMKDQQHPTIVSDGAGGAIVTWDDKRSGSDDIYARRVNASGAVQWTTDGVAVCAATGDQRIPKIASDGAGGAIVTWHDGRDWAWDVYAQRVNASGAVQWTTGGVHLSMADEFQQYAQVTTDGAGGAIVAWDDNRNGDWDIYAARIQYSGTTDIPHASAAVNALSQNYPNPFNPATFITFSVIARGEVKLRIYDAAGRSQRTLVDGWREPGVYRVMWDGKRNDGTAAASGVYFYRIKTADLTATRKMVLLG